MSNKENHNKAQKSSLLPVPGRTVNLSRKKEDFFLKPELKIMHTNNKNFSRNRYVNSISATECEQNYHLPCEKYSIFQNLKKYFMQKEGNRKKVCFLRPKHKWNYSEDEDS